MYITIQEQTLEHTLSKSQSWTLLSPPVRTVHLRHYHEHSPPLLICLKTTSTQLEDARVSTTDFPAIYWHSPPGPPRSNCEKQKLLPFRIRTPTNASRTTSTGMIVTTKSKIAFDMARGEIRRTINPRYRKCRSTEQRSKNNRRGGRPRDSMSNLTRSRLKWTSGTIRARRTSSEVTRKTQI